MFHEDAGPPRPNRVLRLGKQVRPCTVLAGTAMKETVTVVAAALRPQGARHIVVARGRPFSRTAVSNWFPSMG
jgi:hypothetical protein